MNKIFKSGYSSFLFEILLLTIITVPAFISILNGDYFSMHDFQHIARLFLLDNAIHQGVFYPRWVDMLGFNFGYPLFNFYPPLIYYISEIFRLLGQSLVTSLKAMIVVGFLISAYGSYYFIKAHTNKITAFLGSTLYTYFFYHAVTSFVRGAFAEFFSLALLPFVFLAIDRLAKKISIESSILFGLSFGLLILNHPLIAFPSLFFIGAFFLYYMITLKEKFKFFRYFSFGILIGLGISSFFWIPSMLEKKYTLVDSILLTELASYKVHYVYPQQFLNSPWGFGGSISGPHDGITFQLGKIHIILAIFSLLGAGILLFLKKNRKNLLYFGFISLLTFFSLFMQTSYSSFLWDHISFLGYLQFPWRFMTFTSLFLSFIASFTLYELSLLIKKDRIWAKTIPLLALGIIGVTIFHYHTYFAPQTRIKTTDKELTSFNEIAWRVSRSSFEFSPKGVITKKSDLNTTIIDIDKEHLITAPFNVSKGDISAVMTLDTYNRKEFFMNARTPSVFQLNTFNFPGWTAYEIKGEHKEKLKISDNNPYKLITIALPKGNHTIQFIFEDTLLRKISNSMSLITLGGIALFFISRFFNVKQPQKDK